MFRNLKIKFICRKFGIKNYIINEDGSIDVNGNVCLNRNTLSNLRNLDGIRFRKSIKELTELPIKFNIVYGDFRCHQNNLSTFENFPKEVHGDLVISNNNFKSLVGCPNIIKRPFVNNRMICNNNNILTFDGYKEGTNISLLSNPINNIWNLFNKNRELIDLFNDYDAVRENGEISFHRLNIFLIDNGYNTIKRHQMRVLKGYRLIENKEALNEAYTQLLKLKS